MPCPLVLTIGRDRSNGLWISDPLSSRSHAIIRAIGKDYYVLDSGSRNGVFLNSRRISAPVQLKSNDRVVIGETQITFIQQASLDETVNNNVSTKAGTNFAETMHYVRADIRSVVVLVSDIRGFTALSESIPIDLLTKVMSYWFQAVQETVERNGGVVDKFIGDCVLAKWEVERNDASAATAALRTALQLDVLTRGLSQRFPELTRELHIGVGLNKGDAAVGIGADNTILGDVVNTAFRLESSTKDLGCDLVMNAPFSALLPADLSIGGRHQIAVKGKVEQLQVTACTFAEIQKFFGAGTGTN
ncbi:MAG: hypothetical protein RL095_3027 [Verrucomicrobiota bacterium]|jgi:adenylate cyclase